MFGDLGCLFMVRLVDPEDIIVLGPGWIFQDRGKSSGGYSMMSDGDPISMLLMTIHHSSRWDILANALLRAIYWGLNDYFVMRKAKFRITDFFTYLRVAPRV